MATAAPAKPQPPAQKLKRPPPPFVQTGVNGVRPSQATPSPSTTKRPTGLKQPPNAAPTNVVVVNGTAPRTTNRQRKETQRPGEAYRLNRLATRNGAAEVGAPAGSRAVKKAMTEPYVNDTASILKKFSKSFPSLILYLYPTNFRVEGFDGAFGYNSALGRPLLEHVKAKTVPHDMLDELVNAKVTFYDQCLIVRVVDHRSATSTASSSSGGSSADDSNKAFSIHNWNEHLLPSPYAPFPSKATVDNQPPPQSIPDAQAEPTSNGEASNNPDSVSNAPRKREPKVFTTVLHPTPLSMLADMTILATTSAVNRRQSQAFSARTPASTTMPHPPTPLSAVPQTPVNERGPAAKRQKMVLEPKDYHPWEAKFINSVAPPLFLEPAGNLQEADGVLKMMQSEAHCRDPPSPKTRQRTVAELAADEALAAVEERFILIMDERKSTTGTGAAAAGATDGQAGAGWEPRFNRFKTLESIKLAQEEKAKREHERKVQQDLLRRQQQEEADRAKRQQLIEARTRENEVRAETLRRQQQQQQLNQQAHASQVNVNGMMPNLQQQNMMHVSQGQHSSPVIRTQTPQHSSPMASGLMGSQSANISGVQSPVRPGSAAHAGVTAAMAHSMSQNRSQQGPSRNGTPQMPHGTPAMQHATPVMRNVSTPTPRMSHGSPVGSTIAQTPVMNANVMNTPQMPNPNLTPQQMHIMRQQQAYQQQMQNMGGQQMNAQMTPFQQQQFMQQHGIPPQQRGGFPQQQQMNPGQYQNAVRAQMAAQMRNLQGGQQFPNQQPLQMVPNPQMLHGTPGPGQGQRMVNPVGAGNLQGQNQMTPQMQAFLQQRTRQLRAPPLQQAQQEYGPNVPQEVLQEIERRARAQAMTELKNQHNLRLQQSMAMQQARMQQGQQHGMMGGQ